MGYELKLLTSHRTGAEVRGLDLTQPVSDEVRTRLNADFARCHVLAMPAQVVVPT